MSGRDSAPQPPAIRATGVSKSFGPTRAVQETDVTVAAGELVALLGPSGSGKTTLLRIIAGFERADAGTVEIGGRVVAAPGVWVEPEQRRVGMVFQSGALFPHLTVRRNIGFGEQRAGRVQECLELVGLTARADAFPHELSGGERQRVALARALAPEPAVVLLDEPFASLDATLRVGLREEVASILRDAGASALLVTHDQQEALSLVDQVVLMRGGRVQQTGPPEAVYARPSTRWVAGFLGAAEVFEGIAAGGYVDTEVARLPVGEGLSGDVDVFVRPESFQVDALDSARPSCTASEATVVGRTFYGHDQLLRLRLASGREIRARSLGIARWRPGDVVRVRVDGPVHVITRQAAE